MKCILLLQLLLFTNLSFSQTGKAGFRTREIFRILEAKQGVAVDADYFYTGNSTVIGKHSKILLIKVILFSFKESM